VVGNLPTLQTFDDPTALVVGNLPTLQTFDD